MPSRVGVKGGAGRSGRGFCDCFGDGPAAQSPLMSRCSNPGDCLTLIVEGQELAAHLEFLRASILAALRGSPDDPGLRVTLEDVERTSARQQALLDQMIAHLNDH